MNTLKNNWAACEASTEESTQAIKNWSVEECEAFYNTQDIKVIQILDAVLYEDLMCSLSGEVPEIPMRHNACGAIFDCAELDHYLSNISACPSCLEPVTSIQDFTADQDCMDQITKIYAFLTKYRRFVTRKPRSYEKVGSVLAGVAVVGVAAIAAGALIYAVGPERLVQYARGAKDAIGHALSRGQEGGTGGPPLEETISRGQELITGSSLTNQERVSDIPNNALYLAESVMPMRRRPSRREVAMIQKSSVGPLLSQLV